MFDDRAGFVFTPEPPVRDRILRRRDPCRSLVGVVGYANETVGPASRQSAAGSAAGTRLASVAVEKRGAKSDRICSTRSAKTRTRVILSPPHSDRPFKWAWRRVSRTWQTYLWRPCSERP